MCVDVSVSVTEKKSVSISELQYFVMFVIENFVMESFVLVCVVCVSEIREK